MQKYGYSSLCGCGEAGRAAWTVFSGSVGSGSVGPTCTSSPHCHPSPGCCLQCRAAGDSWTAERRCLEGGTKSQWFWYTSIRHGLAKTTANPSLVKCPRREIKMSPANVLPQGLLCAPSRCVKEPGDKLQIRLPHLHQKLPAAVRCMHLYTDASVFSGQKKAECHVLIRVMAKTLWRNQFIQPQETPSIA